MRYRHDRYGADLVSMTGTTTEFAVSRPPRTHPDALQLAWQYKAYNDGYYDFYFADNLTDLPPACTRPRSGAAGGTDPAPE
ncbi:DUF4253 domain-containing protein [Actinoplanes sp. TRM 88003]|uniref:DUF4253 domain-containing protein n=2 Tax=Paractinoplanes aksuensis TaxID=2939490 RepID=A0ABT1DW47_9ACTN|nr:DUF4253 domain-containing protein [Actinoplanes aksuensis]